MVTFKKGDKVVLIDELRDKKTGSVPDILKYPYLTVKSVHDTSFISEEFENGLGVKYFIPYEEKENSYASYKWDLLSEDDKKLFIKKVIQNIYLRPVLYDEINKIIT
jgi:hypothetical protein